jgi:hypothetical protein
VFARLAFLKPGAGTPVPEHVLLRSTDAGLTWVEILRKEARIEQATLSPNAQTLAVGVGCDWDEEYACNPADYGIYKGPSDGAALERIHASPVTCLTYTEGAYFACGVPSAWIAPPVSPAPLGIELQTSAMPPPQDFLLGSRGDLDFTLADAAPLANALPNESVSGPLPWVGERSECFVDWIGTLPGGLSHCERFNQCSTEGNVLDIGTGPPLCQRAGGGGIGGVGGIGGNRGFSGSAGQGGMTNGQWSATAGTTCSVHQPSAERWCTGLLMAAAALGVRRRRRWAATH